MMISMMDFDDGFGPGDNDDDFDDGFGSGTDGAFPGEEPPPNTPGDSGNRWWHKAP